MELSRPRELADVRLRLLLRAAALDRIEEEELGPGGGIAENKGEEVVEGGAVLSSGAIAENARFLPADTEETDSDAGGPSGSDLLEVVLPPLVKAAVWRRSL